MQGCDESLSLRDLTNTNAGIVSEFIFRGKIKSKEQKSFLIILEMKWVQKDKNYTLDKAQF